MMQLRSDFRIISDLRGAGETDQFLTVVININQGKHVNQNRHFQIALKNMVRAAAPSSNVPAEHQAFQENAEIIERFVRHTQSKARTLILISNARQNFFWVRELMIDLENEIVWERHPHLRPLLAAVDDHERIGVVLTDRKQTRLFIIFLNEIEEEKEAFAQNDVRRIKSPGSDHLFSQLQLQRAADLHALQHCKEVARLLEAKQREYRFDRIILAGPSESTHQLFDCLGKALREKVAAHISLSIHSSSDDVLREAAHCGREIERQQEQALVEKLITASKKDARAVVGLERVLEADRQRKISKLVIGANRDMPARRCTNCDFLFNPEAKSCPYCKSELKEVKHVTDVLSEHVERHGGELEQVSEEAGKMLEQNGKIGAFLRF